MSRRRERTMEAGGRTVGRHAHVVGTSTTGQWELQQDVRDRAQLKAEPTRTAGARR
uniref:hypothetical protein n=1 Tax=Streptomyces asoensis TaxID=249586 RepID=UPI003F59E09E